MFAAFLFKENATEGKHALTGMIISQMKTFYLCKKDMESWKIE
jgi:hypothetical protein